MIWKDGANGVQIYGSGVISLARIHAESRPVHFLHRSKNLMKTRAIRSLNWFLMVPLSLLRTFGAILFSSFTAIPLCLTTGISHFLMIPL